MTTLAGIVCYMLLVSLPRQPTEDFTHSIAHDNELVLSLQEELWRFLAEEGIEVLKGCLPQDAWMIIEHCVDYKQYKETHRISETSVDLEIAFKVLHHCV